MAYGPYHHNEDDTPVVHSSVNLEQNDPCDVPVPESGSILIFGRDHGSNGDRNRLVVGTLVPLPHDRDDPSPRSRELRLNMNHDGECQVDNDHESVGKSCRPILPLLPEIYSKRAKLSTADTSDVVLHTCSTSDEKPFPQMVNQYNTFKTVAVGSPPQGVLAEATKLPVLEPETSRRFVRRIEGVVPSSLWKALDRGVTQSPVRPDHVEDHEPSPASALSPPPLSPEGSTSSGESAFSVEGWELEREAHRDRERANAEEHAWLHLLRPLAPDSTMLSTPRGVSRRRKSEDSTSPVARKRLKVCEEARPLPRNQDKAVSLSRQAQSDDENYYNSISQHQSVTTLSLSREKGGYHAVNNDSRRRRTSEELESLLDEKRRRYSSEAAARNRDSTAGQIGQTVCFALPQAESTCATSAKLTAVLQAPAAQPLTTGGLVEGDNEQPGDRQCMERSKASVHKWLDQRATPDDAAVGRPVDLWKRTTEVKPASCSAYRHGAT
jgi:hypothetical protein